MASEVLSIPKLDFSQLESGTTGVWEALQGQVMHALESYGCFEVEYDRVTPELRDTLFGRALPEIFALPLKTKMLNPNTDVFLGGYIGHIKGWAFESLRIEDDVEKFALKLWPEGNPSFCDAVSTYIRHMKVLEQTIVRMIFSDLGIEEYYDSYIQSTKYETQLLEYGLPDKEKKNGMGDHIDQNLVSILCRNLSKGLEIQTNEGEWIPIVPTPNSYTVIIGEGIQTWTNGRLQPPLHHVRPNDIADVKKYTIIYGSVPKDGCVIQPPKELVDEEHPLVTEPYNYQDQILFRYSELEPGVPKEETAISI